MRKLVIGLLGTFRRLLLVARKLRGETPSDTATQRVVSGKSWDEFCDTLKAAGAALTFPGAPRDPFNRAEGYRYLSRLAPRPRTPIGFARNLALALAAGVISPPAVGDNHRLGPESRSGPRRLVGLLGGSLKARIPAENRLKLYRTARSALSAVLLDLAAKAGRTGLNGGTPAPIGDGRGARR